jgi:integrase
MARKPSLIPKHRPRLEALGQSAWELAIPPALSDTGKEKRLFFPTKKAATLSAMQLQNRQANFGISLTALSPARIAEAAEAYKLLENSKLGLLEAVHSALALQRMQAASIPFCELFTQFIEAKAHRSLPYQKELGWTRDRFPQLHARLASDITAPELERILKPLSPGARNPVMRYLRAVFNYGIKRGLLAENPIARLDFIERPRREVEVISNEHVAMMLEHALSEDLPLLPFLVLGFFCGIRPDGELQKLGWSDIHLADKTVVIRSEISKTKRRRFPPLSDNAVAWLNAYQLAGGPISGKLVHYAESELRRHRTINWVAAGLERWIHQGMRHTFCSNWLALHKDVNQLVLISGHDSVDTMWRHYFKGTTEADAKAFWEIRPQKGSSNVIAFQKETNPWIQS